jgi:hypothetical protein
MAAMITSIDGEYSAIDYRHGADTLLPRVEVERAAV